jgi:hypothetical protein
MGGGCSRSFSLGKSIDYISYSDRTLAYCGDIVTFSPFNKAYILLDARYDDNQKTVAYYGIPYEKATPLKPNWDMLNIIGYANMDAQLIPLVEVVYFQPFFFYGWKDHYKNITTIYCQTQINQDLNVLAALNCLKIDIKITIS